MKLEPEFSKWKVDLCLEGVYYHSAREQLKSAKIHYEPLKQIIDTIFDIDEKIKRIKAKYENKLDAYDETESFCIQLDSFYSEMTDKYLPVIRDIAFVHILNAFCLEAYVNKIALNRLNPKSSFDDFDRLSLEGKWVFLPRLVKGPRTFDKGTIIFQGFKNIIKWRNNLVHFKGKNEQWRDYLPPQFFDDLGLKIEYAQQSCVTTKNMIKKLCEYCSITIPKWLDVNFWGVFELVS